ncbi:MAG: endonuclease V [Planctomycetes bacterium]|nr:endonuclease V [Planctomycetota bacterium]
MVSGRWVYGRVTPRRAIEIQNRLRGLVSRRDSIGRVRTVGGVDISVRDDEARGAVVVLDAATLQVVEAQTVETEVRFPYVPGLLSFRETPVLLRAFRKLRVRPDLLIVDGQGYAHPRRFGIACHLGVILDLPAIGCGKTLLVGAYDEPSAERGAWSPLTHQGEVVGAAVRTQDDVGVVYVSSGHRVSLRTATRWIIKMAPRYRLCEPIRAAHHEAGQWDSISSKA